MLHRAMELGACARWHGWTAVGRLAAAAGVCAALWLAGCGGARQPQAGGPQAGKAGAADAVSAATRPGQSVVGSVASDYALLEHPQPRDADLSADAVLKLVRWSSNLSSGLASAASPGAQMVLLVPTVRPEAATDARVLQAVVELCGQVLPHASIVIGVPGDGQIPATYASLVGETAGRLDVRLVALADEHRRSLPAAAGLTAQAVDVPEPVALADAVVVVPALWRDVAGTVHGALDALAALSPVALASDSALVDLVSAVEPVYVFEDVLRPRIGAEQKAMNAVLASSDVCAVDMVAAQLLAARPSAVRALSLAADHELGKASWRDVAVRGVPVPHGKR